MQRYKDLTVTQRGLLIISIGRLIALAACIYGLSIFGSESALSAKFEHKGTVFSLICLEMLTLFQIKLLLNNRYISVLGFCQLLVDVVLLTYAASFATAINAFAIYVVLIGCASLLLNAISSVILAAFCGLCYAFLISNVPDSSFNSSLEIIIAYASLICAALVGASYANQIEGLRRFITKQELELEKISLDRHHLIDSFSEGIITLDLDSAITGINQAAKTLLGLAENIDQHAIGKKIDLVSFPNSSFDKTTLKRLEDTGVTEVPVQLNHVNTTLRYTLQSIKSEYGENSGKVIFISDIGMLKHIEDRLEMHENLSRVVSSFATKDPHTVSSIPGIVGEHTLLKELMLVVEQAAPTDAPILILGESGTGKELIAKAVHQLSPRAEKPFIAINCGAIPEHLLESELFGHKKGSFTGADKETLGLFREASGGTLFLDEIGEMPLHLQAKLLRTLQEGLVRPVGSAKEISVDVRIIAATNKNLKNLVAAKTFREDLFYRLRVIELVLPPLRLRKDDIPALVFHFLKSNGLDLSNVKISSEAWEYLLKYNYPGNVRELENIIQRSIVLGGGIIIPENLPEDVRLYERNSKDFPEQVIGQNSRRIPINLDSYLESIERSFLIEALEETGGRKKDAAKLLGMNFRSFRYRLKKYDLAGEDETSEEFRIQN